jgi:prepilin-type N-terminal cleavage/methylation domain-containing protein
MSTAVRRLSPPRRGLTLIEVLVVLAIVAVLIGLLIPAIQKARAVACEVRCKENLHQIGEALYGVHADHHGFPSSGGYNPDKDSAVGWTMSGADAVTYTRDFGLPVANIFLAFPSPDRTVSEQKGSWSYTILPYLGQENAYRKLAYGAPQPQYACPARRDGKPQSCPKEDPLNPGIFYETQGINPWSRIDYNGNGVLIQCWPNPRARLDQITDGTSTTILVSEKSLDPRAYDLGTWFWDEPAFVGCNVRTGTSIYRDHKNVPFPNNWGSAHPGGPNFMFCDMSVRTLRYGLSSSIVQALLTPAAGDVPGDF